MKTLVTLLLFLSLCFASTAADRATQTDDIRETVFRYQFPKNVRDDSIVLFISVYDSTTKKRSDPSPEFMKRFAQHRPRVLKASGAATDPQQCVIDPKTGKKSVIWEVGEIVWKSENEVEVSGGYAGGPFSGSWSTYFLRKKNGQWAVERDRPDAISSYQPNEGPRCALSFCARLRASSFAYSAGTTAHP